MAIGNYIAILNDVVRIEPRFPFDWLEGSSELINGTGAGCADRS
jgi:hypothetical protein